MAILLSVYACKSHLNKNVAELMFPLLANCVCHLSFSLMLITDMLMAVCC